MGVAEEEGWERTRDRSVEVEGWAQKWMLRMEGRAGKWMMRVVGHTGDGAEGRAGTSRFWQPPTLLGKQLMHTPPYFTQTQFLHFP